MEILMSHLGKNVGVFFPSFCIDRTTVIHDIVSWY